MWPLLFSSYCVKIFNQPDQIFDQFCPNFNLIEFLAKNFWQQNVRPKTWFSFLKPTFFGETAAWSDLAVVGADWFDPIRYDGKNELWLVPLPPPNGCWGDPSVIGSTSIILKNNPLLFSIWGTLVNAILVKNLNFDKKSKFSVKNGNFSQKTKFWSKMEILVKNRNFCPKSSILF